MRVFAPTRSKCWALMMMYLVVVSSILMAEIEAQGGNGERVRAEAEMRSGVRNVTDRLAAEMKRRAGFCIVDEQTDWNRAFNYSNLVFLNTCMAKTRGDAPTRLCTRAEITVYLGSFFGERGLQSNRNCNLSSWVPGCEPRWVCSTGSVERIDLEAAQEIPARTSDCKSCCEGFFCPQGLTCMMPCPLGSYCPDATLNETSGLCEPYNYHLPVGHNHTCDGADLWADFGSSKQVFCPAGSYCPTTTEKIPCDSITA